MKKSVQIVNGKSRHRRFAFFLAVLVTGIIFSPYLGQKIYSDTVAFFKIGDQMQQVFPAFVQAWKLPLRGGSDLMTFNGAREIMDAGPMAYPLFTVFSFLGRFTTFRFAYILFHAIHMAAFIYFGILLGIEHFDLDRKYASLFALSSLTAIFVSAWFVSFYIIATLFLPMLYLSISAVKESRKPRIFLGSVGYVLTFLGGYTTVAVLSCAVAVIITAAYVFLWSEKKYKGTLVIKILSAPTIAGMTVVCYYLQILFRLRVGKVPFADAIALPLLPKDLMGLLTTSINPHNPIENQRAIYIGCAWFMLLGIIVFGGHFFADFSKRKRLFLSVCYCTFGVFLLIAMGPYTPAQYWFYTVPFLGMMHLPIRYLMVIMPLFFLAATLTLCHCEKPRYTHKIYTVGAIIVCIVVFVLLFSRTLAIEGDQNQLLIELILFAAFLLCIRTHEKSSTCVTLLILCTIVPNMVGFYGESRQTKSFYESYSIVYSAEKIKALDRFIDTLPEKERYRFISFDGNDVPVFMPSNYPWYECSEYALTNYLGYPLQLSMPKEYASHFQWYNANSCDWEYIADMRGDFVVLNMDYAAEIQNLMEQYFDMSYDGPYLDTVHKVFRLKKFIPTYYTQGERIEDTGNAMDNGYFYCPSLEETALTGFQTDEGRYFQVDIQSDKNADIAFLFYPSKHYHYYVDDEEIEPYIKNERVYIPIPPGKHQIKIQYKNAMNALSNIIFAIYFGWIVFVFAYEFWYGRRKRNRPKVRS